MTVNFARTTTVVFLALSFATAGMAASEEKREQNMEGMDHSQMDHDKSMSGAAKEASVVGTINNIDAANRMINITHGPVPSIGWPEMTMDIPITKRVDLSKAEIGKPVEFTLKQGRDKTYRVIAIEPK